MVVSKPPFSNPCIVCEPLVSYAGSERYIFETAKALDAPIYTDDFDLSSQIGDDVEINVIEDRITGHIDLVSGEFRRYINYENFTPPREYDLVVTTGLFPKFVTTRPEQYRVHLVQMLYDIFKPSPKGTIKSVKNLYKTPAKLVDIAASNKIDRFIANSEYIERWIETVYNRTESSVIYPPVDIDQYQNGKSEGYFLYLGRLAPEKRVIEIVEELSKTNHQLIVAGDGPERRQIEKIAADNVEIRGYVTEEEKKDLLSHCEALIFNSEQEPFGIVQVEALASGKPVIGVNEGFTPYLIKDGKTGVLFKRGDIIEAIERFNRCCWESEYISKKTQEFSLHQMHSDWKSMFI